MGPPSGQIAARLSNKRACVICQTVFETTTFATWTCRDACEAELARLKALRAAEEQELAGFQEEHTRIDGLTEAAKAREALSRAPTEALGAPPLAPPLAARLASHARADAYLEAAGHLVEAARLVEALDADTAVRLARSYLGRVRRELRDATADVDSVAEGEDVRRPADDDGDGDASASAA